MLNQDPRLSPACFCNASRRNEELFCTAWNVVTHATDLNSRSYFVLERVGAGVKVALGGGAEAMATDVKNAVATWVDKEVVVDRGLITSRNPNDLEAFSAKIIEEASEGAHEERAVA